MGRILSVSYDETLLHTREMLLESRGYTVESALGFTEGLELCKQSDFGLFILGHSIPPADKRALIDAFRSSCPGPIISLQKVSEPDVAGADYYVDPFPESVLKVVGEILGGTGKAKRA
ncbi:MAG TPA: hypothetical protein VKW78_04515 [Terriglobales bacterium]|nr:hypothetical protein [Terriglobales bacterium]